MRLFLLIVLIISNLYGFGQDSLAFYNKHQLKINYLHHLWNENAVSQQNIPSLKNKKNNAAWSPMGCDGSGRINQLLVHPTNSALLLAVTPGGGIWQSKDSGLSWYSNFQHFPSIATNWVQFHPLINGLVYAATGDWRFNVNGDGMYFSRNFGNTWQKRGELEKGIPGNIVKFIFQPKHANQMIAISTKGIYSSADTGSNWQTVHTSFCVDLVQLPSNPDVLLVSQFLSNKLLKSEDFGKTWFEVNTDTSIGSNINLRLAVSNGSPNSVYAYATNKMVYKSTDGGNTFEILGIADANPSYFNMAIYVHPGDSNLIFVGGVGFGYFHTSLGYTGLLNINGNYNGVDYHHFTMANNGTMYLTNDNGIHKSNDGGYTWRKLVHTFNNQEVYSFATSWVSKSCIMGTQDGGSKWITDTCLRVGPNDGGSGILFPGSDQLAISTDQTKRSYRIQNYKTDYMNPYNNLPGNYPYIFNVHPDSFGTVITVATNDILISRDTAKSWHIIKSGLGTSIGIAYHPLHSNRLFVAYNNKVDVSDNFGLTWNKFSGLPFSSFNLRKMAIHPLDSQTLCLIASNNQTQKYLLFVTQDGGKSWDSINPSNGNVTYTNIALNKRGDVFVSTLNKVLKYNTETKAWEDFSNGLSGARITQLSVDDNNDRVVVATFGRGMWESKQNAITQSVQYSGFENAIQIYPNPAFSSFQIKGIARSVHYALYDFCGRKIQEGNTTGLVNINGLKSGYYFVQVIDNNTSQTLKLLVK